MNKLNYYESTNISKRSLLMMIIVTCAMFVVRMVQCLGVVQGGAITFTNITMYALVFILAVIGFFLARTVNKNDERYIDISFFARGIFYSCAALLFFIGGFKMIAENFALQTINILVLLDSLFILLAVIALIVIACKCFIQESEYSFVPMVILICWGVVSLIRNYVLLPVTTANPEKVILLFIAVLSLCFIFFTAKTGLGYKTTRTRFFQILSFVLLLGATFGYLLPNIITDLVVMPSSVKAQELAYLAVSIWGIGTSAKYLVPAMITRKNVKQEI
ncbi:MAG: hypothetical protein RR497_05725 [Oscillospiraceae bacterium]